MVGPAFQCPVCTTLLPQHSSCAPCYVACFSSPESDRAALFFLSVVFAYYAVLQCMLFATSQSAAAAAAAATLLEVQQRVTPHLAVHAQVMWLFKPDCCFDPAAGHGRTCCRATRRYSSSCKQPSSRLSRCSSSFRSSSSKQLRGYRLQKRYSPFSTVGLLLFRSPLCLYLCMHSKSVPGSPPVLIP